MKRGRKAVDQKTKDQTRKRLNDKINKRQRFLRVLRKMEVLLTLVFQDRTGIVVDPYEYHKYSEPLVHIQKGKFIIYFD